MKNTLKTKLIENSEWSLESTRIMCTECVFYSPNTKNCRDNMMKLLGTVDKTCLDRQGIHHEIIISEKKKIKWKIF